MIECKYALLCWRYSYSKYLVDIGYELPPDRLTIFVAGYATQEMMPRGGIFAETMPHKQSHGIVGLCPLIAKRGKVSECGEYNKAMRKDGKVEAEKRQKRVHERRWLPRELRRSVAERFRWKCGYCGINVQQVKCHVDHIVPLSLGGTDEEQNLTLSCVRCNQDKGGEVWQLGCRLSTKHYADC